MLEARRPTRTPRESKPFFANVAVELTPFGRTHALTQLAATEAASAERWKALPALSIVNPVSHAKPGAATLMSAAVNGQDAPRWCSPINATAAARPWRSRCRTRGSGR
jgi:hypothetical protein